MSSINLGSQTITFDYREPATSKDFNELLRDIIKSGVYKGGALTINKVLSAGANEISLAPVHTFLNSEYTEASITYSLAVHAFTKTAAIIDVGSVISGTKYLFVGFTYDKAVSNYLDFRTSTSATPLTNEIILGTMTFDGAGDLATATIDNRTYGGLFTTDSQTYTTRTTDLYIEGTTTLSGATASRLLSTNASKQLTSVSNLASWVAGTSNQITVTNDGDGTITLSAPQNLHTAATPTFAGLTLGTGAVTYTDSSHYIWNLTGLLTTGEYWNTTDNKIEFHSAGTPKFTFDIDDGAFTASTFNGLTISTTTGTLTITNAKTLSVEDNSVINQDLSTDSTAVLFAGLSVDKDQDAVTTISCVNENASTGAIAQVFVKNDIGYLNLYAHSSARTAARYGITLGGYTEIVSSTAGNGLIIGTGILAKPIYFGTNNALRLTIDSAGVINIGASGVLQHNGTQIIDSSGNINTTKVITTIGDITSTGTIQSPTVKVSGSSVTFGMHDTDISHPFTTVESDVTKFLSFYNAGTNAGGWYATALTATDAKAILFRGYIGAASPTNAVFHFRAGKTNGTTGIAQLGSTEIAYQFSNYNGSGDYLNIYGTGDVTMYSGALTVDKDQNATTAISAYNENATSAAYAQVLLKAQTADFRIQATNDVTTATRYPIGGAGISLVGMTEFLMNAGNGIIIGTSNQPKPIYFGTNNTLRLTIGSTGIINIGASGVLQHNGNQILDSSGNINLAAGLTITSTGAIQGASYNVGVANIIDASRNLFNVITVSAGTTNNDCITGTTTGATHAGVRGINNTAGGYGVHGSSTSGYGVYGVSAGDDGIRGEASAAAKSGVSGASSSATGYGVAGVNSSSGIGVYGSSASGYGGVFSSLNIAASGILYHNGTSVLDASRNLTNIGTIGCGAITSTGIAQITISASTTHIAELINNSSSGYGLTVSLPNSTGTNSALSATSSTGGLFDVHCNGEVLMPSLPVAGTGNPVYISSAGGLWENTSSIRFKEKINTLEINTAKLYNLNPKSFNHKGELIRKFGLIAEDVVKEIPEIVTFDKDGKTPRGVDYAMLSVLLLNELKKLKDSMIK